MSVELSLLGPVEALVDGEIVALGGRKQLTVLARLAINVGRHADSAQLQNDQILGAQVV